MIDYLRHPNGRGKLFDDAEANRGTFVDRTSSAHDSAKLRDCGLFDGSKATGNVQVYGGSFYQSTVGGATIVASNPCVTRSLLRCSEVSGTPRIIAADLLGCTEVCDSPLIVSCTLLDAIVYGEPEICGTFTVTGRVHEGTWTRPPKHIKLPWVDLSECIDGKMLLDCYCRPVEWFLRFGRKLAAKWDWSEDQISVTLATIAREFSIPQPANMVYSGEHGTSIPIPTDASNKEAS